MTKVEEEMLPELSNQVGNDLGNIVTSLCAWHAKAQRQGYNTKLLAITFRNLPHPLRQEGTHTKRIVNHQDLLKWIYSRGQITCIFL